MKVLEKQLPIDTEYYKEMISKPLQSVFKLIPETAKSEIFSQFHALFHLLTIHCCILLTS